MKLSSLFQTTHHVSVKLTFSRRFPQLSLASLSIPSGTIHALGKVQKWP
jgi:hypothetical protein